MKWERCQFKKNKKHKFTLDWSHLLHDEQVLVLILYYLNHQSIQNWIQANKFFYSIVKRNMNIFFQIDTNRDWVQNLYRFCHHQNNIGIKYCVSQDVNIHFHFYNLLNLFISQNDLKVVQCLVQLGAHVNHSEICNTAFKHSDLELIQYLVSQGMEIKHLNSHTFMWLFLNQKTDILNYLSSKCGSKSLSSL